MAFLSTIQCNVLTHLSGQQGFDGSKVVPEIEGVLMFVVLFTPRSKWAPLKKGTSTDLCWNIFLKNSASF